MSNLPIIYTLMSFQTYLAIQPRTMATPRKDVDDDLLQVEEEISISLKRQRDWMVDQHEHLQVILNRTLKLKRVSHD
jgi:hypothetical protein